MTSRDQVIAALADEIVSGTHRVHWSVALDRPFLFTDHDTVEFMRGDPEVWRDMHNRLEKYLLARVESWLQSSPRGKALVAERIERDRDESVEELAALGRVHV